MVISFHDIISSFFDRSFLNYVLEFVLDCALVIFVRLDRNIRSIGGKIYTP